MKPICIPEKRLGTLTDPSQLATFARTEQSWSLAALQTWLGDVPLENASPREVTGASSRPHPIGFSRKGRLRRSLKRVTRRNMRQFLPHPPRYTPAKKIIQLTILTTLHIFPSTPPRKVMLPSVSPGKIIRTLSLQVGGGGGFPLRQLP